MKMIYLSWLPDLMVWSVYIASKLVERNIQCPELFIPLWINGGMVEVVIMGLLLAGRTVWRLWRNYINIILPIVSKLRYRLDEGKEKAYF